MPVQWFGVFGCNCWFWFRLDFLGFDAHGVQCEQIWSGHVEERMRDRSADLVESSG